MTRGVRVMVVRPYLANVRDRVFALLRRVGLDMDEAPLVPAGTPDDEAVAAIASAAPRVLLVPFHAHHDAQGNRLDGLTLCRQLHMRAELAGIPVLMPVSTMAAASLRLMSHGGEHAELYQYLLSERVLTIADDEVDLPQTVDRVQDHLRRHGVYPSPPPR